MKKLLLILSCACCIAPDLIANWRSKRQKKSAIVADVSTHMDVPVSPIAETTPLVPSASIDTASAMQAAPSEPVQVVAQPTSVDTQDPVNTAPIVPAQEPAGEFPSDVEPTPEDDMLLAGPDIGFNYDELEEDLEFDGYDAPVDDEPLIIETPIREPRRERGKVVLSDAVAMDDTEFNIEERKRAVVDLVEEGVNFMRQRSLDESFSAFTHDKRFKRGELYLFVYDKEGTCMAHGEQENLIWDDMYNAKDTYGILFVQALIEKARAGGGWVTHQWRNSTKQSYVKEVHKDGKTYVIGCGYYPHSKEDAVVTLVKGAVAVFNEVMKNNISRDAAFGTFSYPIGRFVFGDLYLYALDFAGLQLAHGEMPGIIGTNALNYRDSRGLFVNQEIIRKLKQVDYGVGVWVEYISKNAPKRAYAEKIKDDKGDYFIAAGYYPDVGRNDAVELVKRGYRYMKGNGKSQAIRAFSDRGDNEFRYGDLYLVVYDMQGVVVAHGNNPSLIGRNEINLQDEDGDYYVKEIIEKARSGGGWVDYKERNTFKVAYVEKVNLGIESFIITCGLYPVNKKETMVLLAKSAADFLRVNEPKVAFREFVKENGRFMRGDLTIFTFDAHGICLANGDDYEAIWRKFSSAVDDNGKPYVNLFINAVRQGAAEITYRIQGATRKVHIEPVDKNGTRYVVGSGYFL